MHVLYMIDISENLRWISQMPCLKGNTLTTRIVCIRVDFTGNT